MKNKISKIKFWILGSFGILGFLFISVVPVFAHVIVHPSTIGIAATTDFTMSVPNEKDNPVVAIRLLIPDGVTDVTPNAASGWDINVVSTGTGDNAKVTEIDWADGSIPVGEREEFVFEAQAPAIPATIAWKAYQTYSDGTVVAWDENPAAMKNMSDAAQDKMVDQTNKGPYSTTQVINDLGSTPTPMSAQSAASVGGQTLFIWIAFVLSIVSIGMQLRKNI